MTWILAIAAAAAAAYFVARWNRKRTDLHRASEARFAALMAEAQVAPAPDPGVRQQKLLFDAASKAADAGEPVLAIQLYARLLARYPSTAFAEQARAAVEAQKKNLAKA